MNQERRFPEIKKEVQKPKKDILTEKDISGLANGFSKDEKEVKGFADFVANKFKKMTRRDFLKIAAVGTAATAGLIGRKYIEKNIDNWWTEYQKSKTPEVKEEEFEIEYSKELTEFYDKVSKLPPREREFGDLKEGLELLKRTAEYPEKIKNSEKQSLPEFAQNLSKKEFDNLILGEYHFSAPTPEIAVYIQKTLIENGRKISANGLEGVSYNNPTHIDAVKKFNEGKLSAQEMEETFKFIKRGGFGGIQEPRLEFAKEHSIEIAGIDVRKDEREEVAQFGPDGRFSQISQRVGDIAKEKAKDGIVVTDIGQTHVTADSWENEILLSQLGLEDVPPPKKEALENNYTVQDYLKKIRMKPVAIQMDDWAILTERVELALTSRFLNKVSPKDKEAFYKEAIKVWQIYILPQEEVFVSPYPDSEDKENTFSLVIPTQIPEIPPLLNGYKAIYDQPILADMFERKGVLHAPLPPGFAPMPNLVIAVKTNKYYKKDGVDINLIPVAEVDKKTGRAVKIYLPEQAKKKMK